MDFREFFGCKKYKLANRKEIKPIIQKFRKIVQKHFLTKSLEELEDTNIYGYDVNFTLRKHHFCNVLDDMFWRSGQTNLGLKYKTLPNGLFENPFLDK